MENNLENIYPNMKHNEVVVLLEIKKEDYVYELISERELIFVGYKESNSNFKHILTFKGDDEKEFDIFFYNHSSFKNYLIFNKVEYDKFIKKKFVSNFSNSIDKLIKYSNSYLTDEDLLVVENNLLKIKEVILSRVTDQDKLNNIASFQKIWGIDSMEPLEIIDNIKKEDLISKLFFQEKIFNHIKSQKLIMEKQNVQT